MSSSSNCICVPLNTSTVDVLTFGESSLFGYDCSRDCLVACSFTRLTRSCDVNSDLRSFRLSPPIRSSSIRRLILNEDETIVALVADQMVFLVYLPPVTHWTRTGTTSIDQIFSSSPLSLVSPVCPTYVVPRPSPSSEKRTTSVLEFLWISPMDFFVVDSSSVDCLHYRVREGKEKAVEHLHTFTVVCPREQSGASGRVPSRRGLVVSPSSHVVRLILSPRRRDDRMNRISLFAMLNTGDIFLLELDSNDLEKT